MREDCMKLKRILLVIFCLATIFAFAGCKNLQGIYISETTTMIDPNAFDEQTNLTIYGLNGSVAEQYARQHGFQFVTIDSTAFSN